MFRCHKFFYQRKQINMLTVNFGISQEKLFVHLLFSFDRIPDVPTGQKYHWQ